MINPETLSGPEVAPGANGEGVGRTGVGVVGRTGDAPHPRETMAMQKRNMRIATTLKCYFVARAGAAALLYAILPPTNVITGLMSLI